MAVLKSRSFRIRNPQFSDCPTCRLTKVTQSNIDRGQEITGSSDALDDRYQNSQFALSPFATRDFSLLAYVCRFQADSPSF
jgi:hypothetical protein